MRQFDAPSDTPVSSLCSDLNKYAAAKKKKESLKISQSNNESWHLGLSM
jgi:hypothetical protein